MATGLETGLSVLNRLETTPEVTGKKIGLAMGAGVLNMLGSIVQ